MSDHHEVQRISTLSGKAAEVIAELLQLEKQVSNSFKKMEKAAVTDELAKCLSPVSTDAVQHLTRLQLLQKNIGKPTERPSVSKPITLKWKKPHTAQDLEMIKQALSYQNQKLAAYEFLHPLLSAMELQLESELVAQTITDNRNTNTWLRQIIQNILCKKLNE